MGAGRVFDKTGGAGFFAAGKVGFVGGVAVFGEGELAGSEDVDEL